MKRDISRRKFLKIFGGGTLAATAALVGCGKSGTAEVAEDDYRNQVEPPVGKMSYRTNPKTNDKVSLLGYGMMRLPTVGEKGNEIGRAHV